MDGSAKIQDNRARNRIPSEISDLPLEDLSEIIPNSTTQILANYQRVSRLRISDEELLNRRQDYREYGRTVDDLRKWDKARRDDTLMTSFARRVTGSNLRNRKPSDNKIYSCVYHHFPPPMEIVVFVCDFGPGRAERKEVRLGDLEAEFTQKPRWAQVRWIHAPLGVGLLHSSIESLFYRSGSKIKGKPFDNAGRPGWPYLELEALDIRSKQRLQNARDTIRILESDDKLKETLNRSIFAADNNDTMRTNFAYRSRHMGLNPSFWDLACADLPWQLSNGNYLSMDGPLDGLNPSKLSHFSQPLADNGYFQDAYLARNPFRCFHRNDGYLLTMSSAGGVDYLNVNLPHYHHMSRHELHQESLASSVAQIYREFSATGTDTWHRKTVEWFLVYLVTEIGSTPHNIRQGYSAPSLTNAFESTVQDLKQRRYDDWRQAETIALVRSFLRCIDDVSALEEIFNKKADFIRRLMLDCEAANREEDEEQNLEGNKDGETALDRVRFAHRIMEESRTQCGRLKADLRESLHSLFQLRSIEQNEMAILAEKKNNAIFVVTGFTVIFLPLSFFTSYFGMDLKGIIGTDKTERDFWEVCGTIAFIIILIPGILAMRYHVHNRVSI